MKSNVPTLMVSVESLKGGVGKTTAALCLGRLLLERKYATLLLDLDVTGTNAAYIANSPFWRSDIHVITDEKQDSTNLITLFEQRFMLGKPIPEFTQEPLNKCMQINFAKVNVMGSQIYDTSDSDESKKAIKATCIERPSILFDDLHALWLLEFVKQVIENFIREASKAKGKNNVAIILDNSPGHVGIAPAIHEWLTDRGPADGKFLTVTSLDEQDLRACDLAMAVLHGRYKNKWETSRQFISACTKDGKTINISKEQETFFVRLATSDKTLTDRNNSLSFYETKNESIGKIFYDDPRKYLAVIINRVPRAVKRSHLGYEKYFTIFNKDNVLRRLLGDNTSNQAWRNQMISYDEYIENQFLLQMLQRTHRRFESKMSRLIHSLEQTEYELIKGGDDGMKSSRMLSDVDFEFYERVKSQLVRAGKIVGNALATIETAGLGHLVRLIHDEWLPNSIVPNFQNALMSLLRETDVPYFEMFPFEFDTGPVNPEACEFVRDIAKHIKRELPRLGMVSCDAKTVETLLVPLSKLVGMSLTSPLWHRPMSEEIDGLFAVVLAIELKHWDQRKDKQSGRSSIQQFLASETVNRNEIEKNMELFHHFHFFRRWKMDWKDTSFRDFYSVCTSAQARLIDFIPDAHFLIQLLHFVVKEEMKKGALFPFVRGLAEDVIINKSISHQEAPKRMAKAIQTVEYFKEFDGVLKNVLSAWGV